MNTEQIIALILQGGPIALDMFLKLESILNLSADEKTNIVNAVTQSDAADDETITQGKAWLEAHPL